MHEPSPPSRHQRAAAAGLFLGGAFALVWIAVWLWTPTFTRRLPVEVMAADTGLAWHVGDSLAPRWLHARSDQGGADMGSQLALTEDGRTLGPAHAPHMVVRTNGAGAYSHWRGGLWFSTSDGSDPRTNGRRYTIAVPLVPQLGWLCGALALAAASGATLLQLRWRRDPDPFGRLRRATGGALLGVAVSLLVALVVLAAWLPTIRQELTPATTGEVDMFGNPRAWRIPPFCIGRWPDRIVAERADEAMQFDLPVAPSVGSFALVALLATTGLWLRRKRRRTWSPSPLLAAPWVLLQAAVPTAALLLALDIAGTLTAPLRAPLQDTAIAASFGPLDRTRSWSETRDELDRHAGEPATAYVTRLTELVADTTAHVWDRRFARELRLQVPASENWMLWLWGEFDSTQREYWFVDAERMLERGVGMCGQVAYALGELLADAGFDARMVQLGGHTVVTVDVDGAEWMLDPDYRVVLPHALDALSAEPMLATAGYEAALQRFGRPDAAAAAASVARLFDAAGNSVSAGRPAASLPPSMRYRETFAYLAKWSVPLLLLASWLAVERIARRRPVDARIGSAAG